ncbi:hypothetical protein Zmor_019367 [Zophobas morio]|uniref:Ionotropic receptor n=1 Tax=Zophobas morio TaxID=2755281 RepID=A0AA38I1W1_9CUCU|nr:hypothetical protein Zmor_019367 [Zophobas morio]
MSRVLLLIFLIVVEDHSSSIHESVNEHLEAKSDLLVTIYQRHFYLVRLLTISVLQTRDNYLEIRDFADTVLSSLKRNETAIKIEEKFLHEVITTTERKVSSNIENRSQITDDNPSEEELFKIKKSTTDFGEGHLLVAWDANIFHQFLDEYPLVPKARSTYAIVFCSSSHPKNPIHTVLARLWTTFKVLNAIAVVDDQIYIYRPFVQTDHLTWGITDNYNLPEVHQNPLLMSNPLTDLNQFPLRISLFEKNPTAIKKLPHLLQTNPIYKDLSPSKGFAGSDGLIIGTLAQYLNFDPVIPKDLPPFSFGHVLPNGSSYGVLFDLLNNKSDYGGNCRLMSYYKTDGIEFTVPYSSDKISLAVPKSQKVPRWRTLFTCFDKVSWIVIFGVCIACITFWYYLRASKQIVKSSWEMYSFLVGIPCKVVPSLEQIVFLCSCMMFNIIVLGIIQGSMFTDFTATRYYPDMETLEEVIESGLPIMSFAWLIVTDSNRSTLLAKLKERTIDFSDDRFGQIALYRNVAVMDRLLDIELEVKTKFVGQDGVPLLHIAKETLTTHLTTSVVPKGSPYLVIFNRVIRKLIEGGLISKWYDDVVESLIIEHSSQTIKDQPFKPFAVEDVQAAFYVIVVGYGTSAFIFFCEILLNCNKHTRTEN